MRHRSHPPIPDLDVCRTMASEVECEAWTAQFRRLTHTIPRGREFWRLAVLKEFLPEADSDLSFEAVAE